MNKNFTNQEYLKNIRQAFYGYNAFGLWKLEHKTDKKGNLLYKKNGDPDITKVPYSAHTLKKTDPTSASSGASIDQVIRVLKKDNSFNGVALFLTHDLYFIDLDNVSDEIEAFNNDNYNTAIGDFLQNTYTYTELSQSGNGLHIIGKGKKQTDRCKKPIDAGKKPIDADKEKDKKKMVEIYDSQRFVALTGNVFNGRYTLHEIPQETTKYFEDKYLGATQEKNKDVDVDITVDIATLPTIDASVDEIIKKLEDSSFKHAEKFKTLFYTGNWQGLGYESQSNADLGFIRIILEETKGDYQKTKKIFDSSALFRDKTDSKRGNSTYYHQTFLKAYKSYKDKKNNSDNNKNYSWTDRGNAKRFLDSQYADRVLFVSDLNKWYIYDGIRWTFDSDMETQKWIEEVLQDIKKSTPTFSIPDTLSESEQKKETEKLMKAWNKYLKSLDRSDAISRTLTLVKHHRAKSQDIFDKQDHLINCQNGVIDISKDTVLNKGIVLSEHKPDHYLRQCLNANYNPLAKCPKWEKFLQDVIIDEEGNTDNELLSFLQRAVGYSLTTSTDEQKIFILNGKGGNGKGVFVHTLEFLFGNEESSESTDTQRSYNGAMSSKALVYGKNDTGGHTDDVAVLKNTRFVTIQESNEKDLLDESRLKTLTGGDMISASRKNKGTFKFKPKFKMWLSTNYLPVITGNDDGIWRRLAIIDFLRQYKDHEKNVNLESELREEIDGIFNWALEGLQAYYKNGLEIPKKIQEKVKKIRLERDPVSRFVKECCEILPTDLTKSEIQYHYILQSKLLNIYNEWATLNGEPTFKKRLFLERLKNVDSVHKKEINKGTIYFNLKIKI